MMKNNKIQFGFSLLELTIVLAIVGVLGLGSLLVYSEQQVHSKWQESDAKLKVVKKALIEHVRINKFMPCPDNDGLGQESRSVVRGRIPAVPAIPATSAVPRTATSPTIPAVPATPAQPAIPNIPVSTCTDNSGAVPYEMLGLTAADVADSWGNPFVYAVDQGTTVANNLLNCPEDSSCFFNKDPIPSLPANRIFPGTALPAFDEDTLPIKNNVGVNNLQICKQAACTNTEAEGLVAVLLAVNENGEQLLNLAGAENENRDGDLNFVNQRYSEAPYYDDLLIGISGHELKTKPAMEAVVAVSSAQSATNTVLTGNDLQNMGDNTVGSSGTNVWTDDAIVNTVQQSFDFGADAAGKQVVITLNTHARGTWDQPTQNNRNITSDTGTISANGTVLEEYKYEYRDDTQDGYETVSYAEIRNGEETGNTITREVDYWDTSEEFVVTLDDNGQVELDFTVATTANYETIDFTDIELALYNAPPTIPPMPSVNPISGVSQTEGLS